MYRFLSEKEIKDRVKPEMVWNGYPVVMDNEDYEIDIVDLGSIFGEKMGAYIVTDKSRINGAAVIMYATTLNKLKEMGIKEFYLLPSSIHEVIIFPCESNVDNDRKLTAMVREINDETVKNADKLSDTILYYDGENWTEVNINES